MSFCKAHLTEYPYSTFAEINPIIHRIIPDWEYNDLFVKKYTREGFGSRGEPLKVLNESPFRTTPRYEETSRRSTTFFKKVLDAITKIYISYPLTRPPPAMDADWGKGNRSPASR